MHTKFRPGHERAKLEQHINYCCCMMLLLVSECTQQIQLLRRESCRRFGFMLLAWKFYAKFTFHHVPSSDASMTKEGNHELPFHAELLICTRSMLCRDRWIYVVPRLQVKHSRKASGLLTLDGSCKAQRCTKLNPMKSRAALKVLPTQPVQYQDQIVPLTLHARSLGQQSKSVSFSSYP